jgi:hypothetical protein
MHKGMTSGLFADSIDVWCAFALYTLKNKLILIISIISTLTVAMASFTSSSKTIYLPSIQKAFSANYFVAFHKDPDNLTCTCPLDISTALHCLTDSLVMTIFQNAIVQYLLPDGQFGIAVPGGTDYCHSLNSIPHQPISL